MKLLKYSAFILCLLPALLCAEPLISQLEVGDRIPKHTAEYYGLDYDLKEGQELLIISISADKTQMTTKPIDKVREEEITTQEFYRRALKLLE